MIGKYIFIFFVVVFTMNLSFALSVEECLLQAEAYGDGKSKAYINPSCLGLFEGLKSKVVKAKSIDESKEITAFETIIFVEDLLDKSKKLQIYAGHNTLMSSVKAIAWDEKNNEFAILDSKRGQVLFFSSIIDGNVSPLRVLESEYLIEADSLIIDSIKNEVIIINTAVDKKFIFSRLANKFGRSGHKKLGLVRSALLLDSALD